MCRSDFVEVSKIKKISVGKTLLDYNTNPTNFKLPENFMQSSVDHDLTVASSL